MDCSLVYRSSAYSSSVELLGLLANYSASCCNLGSLDTSTNFVTVLASFQKLTRLLSGLKSLRQNFDSHIVSRN